MTESEFMRRLEELHDEGHTIGLRGQDDGEIVISDATVAMVVS